MDVGCAVNRCNMFSCFPLVGQARRTRIRDRGTIAGFLYSNHTGCSKAGKTKQTSRLWHLEHPVRAHNSSYIVNNALGRAINVYLRGSCFESLS